MNSNNQEMHLIGKGILRSIPNEPKIPLYNYLLDLTSESDGKEKSLYLNNVNSFIKGVWEDIVKNNYRKLNVKQFIPKELDVSTGVFYAYKNGKKGISIQMLYKLLQLWGEYCNKDRDDIGKKWNEIFWSEYVFSVSAYFTKTKLPKHITPKLSYLIGWLVGDGHFNDKGNHYLVKISEKFVDQLECILKPLFRELFNVETPIFRRYMGGYALQIGSKPIYRFFTQIIKVKVGEIPKIVSSMDLINKKYFLRGILDSEGWVSTKRPRISISQSDKGFLLRIIELLCGLNIKCNGPIFHKSKLGEWYSIRIESKMNFIRFVNSVGSSHIYKLKRIKRVVNKIACRDS